MTSLLLATLILSLAALSAAPAQARAARSTGTVYSTAGGGLWIVVHGMFSGCETGFPIAQSG